MLNIRNGERSRWGEEGQVLRLSVNEGQWGRSRDGEQGGYPFPPSGSEVNGGKGDSGFHLGVL